MIHYVLDKAEYMNGYGVVTKRGANHVVKDFKSLKKECGKEGGRQLYHIIISFKDVRNAKEAYLIVKKVTRIVLRDMQYVFGIHMDTNIIHAHVVINSVTVQSGFKKLHFSRLDEEELLYEIADLCYENLNPDELHSEW